MKNTAYSFLLSLSIAVTFLAGSWYGQQAPITPATAGPPEIVNGQAPTHVHGRPAVSGGSPSSASPGAVRISPETQQLLGLRVSPVEKASRTHTLRLLGRVAPDETRLYRLTAGIEGFIREVSTVTTGSQVKKEQLLATFSAPNSVQIIQQYILVLGAADRVKQAITERSVEAQAAPLANSNYQQRASQLRNLGMSVSQMEEIQRTREVPESIKILAPADGVVLARNVTPDQKLERGAELFRIADLSRVWILADVFENEAQYLRPGMHAQVSLASQRKTLPARVAEVLPQFDPTTRTLKVRLEADNPGIVLRPDMFVDVELPVTHAPTLAIPADAILDSGVKKTVFIDRGEGLFEPRQVETGWRFGDNMEIVKGLKAGDRIVTACTFLLDSESRMNLAAARISATSGAGEPSHTEHEHAGHQHAAHQHP